MPKPISYTPQEAFNIVAKHLLTQKAYCRKKTKKTETGFYNRYHFKGRKCAIGALIPSSRYKPKLETLEPYAGLSACNIHIISRSLPANKDVVDFLDRLQFTHDHVPILHWRKSLQLTAQIFHLDAGAIND